MSYIDQNLIAQETVLYRTRLHWIVLLTPFAAAAISAIFAVWLLMGAVAGLRENGGRGMGIVGLLFLAIAAGFIVFGLWHRSSTEMAVTNKRVMVKTGMLSRRTTEMMLTKVESVSVDQTILGRIWGYGSITVRGTGGTPEPFSRIGHPLEFRRKIQQQLDRMGVATAIAANSAGEN